MSSGPNRTLVIPGELRPDLVPMLGVPADGLDCLLAAPGLLDGWPGLSEVVRDPRRLFSSSLASSHRQALIASFVRAVDALPRTPGWADGLRGWCQALGNGQIRVHQMDRFALFTRMVSTADATLLPMAPLLLGEEPGGELKVELTGVQHERARAWFGELFAQSVDMSGDVRAVLESSWAVAHPSPRDLYYKTLIEYFRELVEGADVEGDDNRILEVLTDFQQSAYTAARTILRRYGGVFLADVVGLGKTFIALALLSHYQERYGEHGVVIAPPAVLPAWIALASEYRVELATVSIGSLDELAQYSDRDIVVIDESHNFRNTDT
ncbi:MAG: hypothetical protein JWN04_1163, partial [Myxococcaceae bacterium]|nr:hypothetical protein [Myxococcaceae bacterium]